MPTIAVSSQLFAWTVICSFLFVAGAVAQTPDNAATAAAQTAGQDRVTCESAVGERQHCVANTA